jgi:DNA-binding NarL/FixJ family response regulator
MDNRSQYFNTPKYRILIVEDHTIFRASLRALISAEPGFEVVGEAGDGREAIDCAERLEPHLVLIDLSMPKMNGTDAIREIKRQSPGSKILVLTAYDTQELVLSTFEAGAEGYLLKDSTRSELILAMKKILAGKRYISPDISGEVIHGYLAGRISKIDNPSEPLTLRERVILKLAAEGYPNKQIAEDLCISVKTVAKHRSNFMRKLNLHSTAEIKNFAKNNGIVE